MTMKYTVDNDEIRGWMEEHGGTPAILKETSDDGLESPDMLHISFNPQSPDMEEMDWEEFFERFENENLALVYDDEDLETTPPDFELIDRDMARAEYAPEIELPDSGDEDLLLENTSSDIDSM